MTTDPTTPTTDPTSPAPAPPQSVRIETTLWWEDEPCHGKYHRSTLWLGDAKSRLKLKMLAGVEGYDFSGFSWILRHRPREHWNDTESLEAAKAAALQAVMGAIGAREVGK